MSSWFNILSVLEVPEALSNSFKVLSDFSFLLNILTSVISSYSIELPIKSFTGTGISSIYDTCGKKIYSYFVKYLLNIVKYMLFEKFKNTNYEVNCFFNTIIKMHQDNNILGDF